MKGWFYVQEGLWKFKSTYHFLESLGYFVLKTELLLTVLPNFEREAAFKDLGCVLY